MSSWIKCHHPAVFLCALLNSQPMGFYQPAQLIRDAWRHGVEVLAVDAQISTWQSKLEPGENPERPAVRLGLRLVDSLSEAAVARIMMQRPFASVEDMAKRAELARRDLQALAAAGALATLAGHRHQAHWQVAGVETAVLREATVAEAPVQLAPPAEGRDILADYTTLGFTLGRHPLALLRPRLKRLRLSTALELAACAPGAPARACGIVTHRQRPQTAKGTVFVTLEDETGSINVVVWSHLVERQRRALLGARLLAVYGIWETDGKVTHLIARELIDHTSLLGRIATHSRDFH